MWHTQHISKTKYKRVMSQKVVKMHMTYLQLPQNLQKLVLLMRKCKIQIHCFTRAIKLEVDPS